jgi:hypothetical protein
MGLTIIQIANAVEDVSTNANSKEQIGALKKLLSCTTPDDVPAIVTILTAYAEGQWQQTTLALLDDHLARKRG